MNFRQPIVFLFLLALGFYSCQNHKTSTPIALTQQQITEKLLEANKAAVNIENEQIDKLIADSTWQMSKTETGLRYQILENGNGTKVELGKKVRFEYDVKLISGVKLYSSAQSGLKEFVVGSGGVESGLEEGILLMKVGDKIRFILPSYLAHGLSGDQDKIPPKATLIYTIKLTEVK